MEENSECELVYLDTSEYKKNVTLASSFVDSASRKFNFDLYPRKTEVQDSNTQQFVFHSEKLLHFRDGYILPKNNNETIDEIPDLRQNTMQGRTLTGSKWKRLSLVVKSLTKLKTTDAKTISDLNGLKSTIFESSGSPRSPWPKCDTIYVTYGELARKAMRDTRDQTRFFKALDRASEEDVYYIQERLRNDPSKNLFDADDRFSLANRQDHRGYTPLYVTCVNGNLNVVKLLLEFGANPYQYSEINKEEKESNLVVAVRWNHIDLSEYLLQPEYSWPQKDLKKAYKIASNKYIKKLIKGKLITKMGFIKKMFL